MKNAFVAARQFAKFARRHWKFIIGVCTSCAGMYLMSKGEYDTAWERNQQGILRGSSLSRHRKKVL